MKLATIASVTCALAALLVTAQVDAEAGITTAIATRSEAARLLLLDTPNKFSPAVRISPSEALQVLYEATSSTAAAAAEAASTADTSSAAATAAAVPEGVTFTGTVEALQEPPTTATSDTNTAAETATATTTTTGNDNNKESFRGGGGRHHDHGYGHHGGRRRGFGRYRFGFTCGGVSGWAYPLDYWNAYGAGLYGSAVGIDGIGGIAGTIGSLGGCGLGIPLGGLFYC